MRIIHQQHDKLFKQSMSDIRVAKEFFATHLPPELLEKVELDTLKLQKHSFIDPAYKASEADVLYCVKTGKVLGYFYLLCEHQTKIDRLIAFRLLVYLIRIVEIHLKKYPNSSLPIVYPIVIYSGDKPWDAPKDIFELFGEYSDIAMNILYKPYHLIELRSLDDRDMRKRRWAGLVEFVLKYRKEQNKKQNLAKFLEKLLPWLYEIEVHDGVDYAKIILKYIVNGLEANDERIFIEKSEQLLSKALRGEVMTLAQRFEQIGLQRGVQKGLKKGLQQGKQQGLELGLQQGKQQGLELGLQQAKEEMARKLLMQGMALSTIAQITELPLEKLQKLKQDIAASME